MILIERCSLEIDLNLPAPRVIRVLDRIISWRGIPDKLRMDNGPEFISVALADWAEKNDIKLEFTNMKSPHKMPTSNDSTELTGKKAHMTHWVT